MADEVSDVRAEGLLVTETFAQLPVLQLHDVKLLLPPSEFLVARLLHSESPLASVRATQLVFV